MIASRPSARTAMIRSVLVFLPLLALALATMGVLLRAALDGGGGAYVGLAIIGLVALLIGYQVVQSLRDLLGEPVETEGLVERSWSRNEYFVFRNSYVFVQGDVFRLSPEQEIEVELGNLLRIRHFRHTATVVGVEVLSRMGATASDV